MSEQDPMLGEGRGLRYYATFRNPDDNRIITVSVNYDPHDHAFGTIKESSGKE